MTKLRLLKMLLNIAEESRHTTRVDGESLDYIDGGDFIRAIFRRIESEEEKEESEVDEE